MNTTTLAMLLKHFHVKVSTKANTTKVTTVIRFVYNQTHLKHNY